MSKNTFTRKRYDADAWQVFNGGDLVALIEAFSNGMWGIHHVGGGQVTKAKFPNVSEAFRWLNENPDRVKP